jgi:L-fucose isomerase-like protein
MYESLNCFEEALKHFGTRVEMITAMEMAKRISAEDAYQLIKEELKEVKKCRKHFNKQKEAIEYLSFEDDDGL